MLHGSAQEPGRVLPVPRGRQPVLPGPAGHRAGQDGPAGRAHRRRTYHLVDYAAPDAERVLVLMGSGAGAAAGAVEALIAAGERVGLLTVRLYRPFPARELAAALRGVRALAVLDRTEAGATGERSTRTSSPRWKAAARWVW